MFPFQYRFFKQLVFGRSAFSERNIRRRMTRALFLASFPTYEAINAGLLELDHLVFPQFKQAKVDAPVFIIGTPRSGTTLFHRLLALDEEQFIAAKLWQILFPSLTSQAFWQTIIKFDGLTGSNLQRQFNKDQERFFKTTDKFHQFRLDAPEEDEGLLIHLFASGFLALVFPSEAWDYYRHFDEMPSENRREIMRFYRECIQRILYAHGGNRHLLSKNPNFSTKVNSLFEEFPDAKMIYLVRNPAESLCSLHDMIHAFWTAQGLKRAPGQSLRHDPIVRETVYIYRHALKSLDQAPAERCAFVRYEDLVANPIKEVHRVYEKLELSWSPSFEQKLKIESDRASKFKSKHKYDLSKYDISHSEIEEKLAFVYERFGYSRRDATSSDRTQ